MSTAEAYEIGDVLERVKTWPPLRRITLAKRILETLETPTVAGPDGRPGIEEPTRGWPVEKALGLLRTDRQPPDDEDCRRIIEEQRWKKYGS